MNKKTFFISDIHLGNKYGVSVEKRLTAWLDSIRQDAAAVYFLGDVFDYWYEYKDVVPRGHVRFLGKLAELSDAGVEIHFIIGNHDIWMFDYLPSEIGAIVHHDPFTVNIDGRTFFLAHGDEVGYRPFSYRLLQSIFRSRFCQILYSSLHPRWTFWFARRWSLSSRLKGMQEDKFIEAQRKNLNALEIFSGQYLQEHPEINYFIFGHLHILVNKSLTPTAHLFVIGDWIKNFSCAVWDGEKIDILQL